NSNSLENNHLEVFDLLKNVELPTEMNLIVPLSYGNDVNYKTTVLGIGENLFGHRFLPLIHFMTREQYMDTLATCSAAVFYHFRQQAMGNILALLYLGARVYLCQKNPLFHYFNRIGVFVYDFDTEFKVFKN